VHRSLRRVTSPDCGSMPARADELARRILRTYQDRNRAYDEETRHGSTEGLRWPPAAAGDAAPARRTGSEPTG
jgi:predicted secreted Zn-dependent protease